MDPMAFPAPEVAAPADVPDLHRIPDASAPPEMSASQAFSVGRAIDSGWFAVKRAPLQMWLGAFLLWITDQGCNGHVPGGGSSSDGRHDDALSRLDTARKIYASARESIGLDSVAHAQPATSDSLFLVGLGIGLIVIGLVVVAVLCLRAWIVPGTIRLHHHLLQTGDAAWGPLFSGGDRFVHQLLWQLLSFLLLTLAVALAVGPGVALAVVGRGPMLFVGIGASVVLGIVVAIYVGLGLTLGDCVVTLENRGPIDTLKRSWHLANGNRAALLWYAFVGGLVGAGAVIVGLIMLCVGVLLTCPVGRATIDFGRTESFLLLTRGQGISSHWRLWSGELRALAA